MRRSTSTCRGGPGKCVTSRMLRQHLLQTIGQRGGRAQAEVTYGLFRVADRGADITPACRRVDDPDGLATQAAEHFCQLPYAGLAACTDIVDRWLHRRLRHRGGKKSYDVGKVDEIARLVAIAIDDYVATRLDTFQEPGDDTAAVRLRV